jgi:outer membrane protein insertion porin family
MLLGFCRQAAGQERPTVGSVELAGLRTLSEATVLAKVRTRVGDVFDPAVAADDAKRIAELSAVAYAYYNSELQNSQVKLTFVVVEKNIVREIVFAGNHHYGPSALQRKLGFKQGDFLEVFSAREGAEVISDFYRKEGFAFVKVQLDDSSEGPLSSGKVVYRIEEGPRVKIKKVRFSGNRMLKSSALAGAVKSKSRKWLFWPGLYDQQKLSADAEKLMSIYQKKGYLDARVEPVTEFAADKRAARVNFVISEGPLYLIERLSIVGAHYFDEQKLLSQLRQKQGKPYSQTVADSDRQQLVSIYRSEGFINASVEQRRIFTDAGEVRCEFEVTEGEQFRIGQVNITGNSQTQDKVVRRVLDERDFKPGQWYNADIARGDGQGELEKAIRQTAMMESATIMPGGERPGRRDAQVSVVEGQTGMVMVGAGVDSSMGLIGQLIFEQRNFNISDWPESWGEFIMGRAFKGAGQQLRVALEPGTQVTQYSVSFTEPYLRDKPVRLDVVGSRYMRGQESYDEVRSKGFVGFEKRDKQGWRRGIGFRLEDIEVKRIEPDAPDQVRAVAGDNWLAGVRLSMGRDKTDNVFNPTQGYDVRVGYEQVGGDDTFGVLDGTYRWYHTLFEDLAGRKTVLAAKLHGATTVGEAPVFEKFYAGGIGSIRGFDYRGVSTRAGAGKDPIGSDWLFLAGAEATVPLTLEVLSWLFFVDSGTVDSGSYRVAVGTGIQILIPQWFGPVPMKFELGIPVMKDDDDETQVFSFSVGRLF